MSDDAQIFYFNAPDNLPGNNLPPTLDDSASNSNIQVQGRPPSLHVHIPDPQLKGILMKMETLRINTIYDLPWHIKTDIYDLLMKEKEEKNDWRGLASRLGLKDTFIDKMENSPPENPCKEVLEQKCHEKVSSLVHALYNMKRQDVLDVIQSKIDEHMSTSLHVGLAQIPEATQTDKQQKWKTSARPSQETTPESTSSTCELSSPPFTPSKGGKSPATPMSPEAKVFKKDNGSAEGRKRSESNPGQNSDITHYSKADEHETKLDFHSAESKSFWSKIPPKPNSTRKEWKQFEKALNESFPKDCKESQLLRFICYTLKVDYDERHNQFVCDQDYSNMVAWFGPLKEGGCLANISKLIKESVGFNSNTGGHSFFAGYLSKDECDKAVMDEKPGTFLIRFSTSYAHEGKFVLVLKTENGPENHIIPQQDNPFSGTLAFDGKTYSNLIHLYKDRLRRGGVSQDRRTSCVYTCPNLPLNAMFRKYNSGPLPASAMGRGRRGRGRQQNV